MIQTFHSLDEACRRLRVVLPAPREGWRLVQDPVVGSINGLANNGRFAGWTVATNGIMVLLLSANEKDFWFGHLQWFEADKTETNAELSDVFEKTKTKKTKKTKVLKDYVF